MKGLTWWKADIAFRATSLAGNGRRSHCFRVRDAIQKALANGLNQYAVSGTASLNLGRLKLTKTG